VASSRRLRALITNDDGIESPGLHVLAALARDAGFDVVVAAPHEDASGVGASVKAERNGGGVRLHRREIPVGGSRVQGAVSLVGASRCPRCSGLLGAPFFDRCRSDRNEDHHERERHQSDRRAQEGEEAHGGLRR
jgi:hypothetical protein